LLGIITNLTRELQDVKAALIDARLELEEAEEDRADYELKLEELGMDKDDAVERAEVCQLSLEEMSAEVARAKCITTRVIRQRMHSKRTRTELHRLAPDGPNTRARAPPL
jgi:chromosome segregation ATPase